MRLRMLNKSLANSEKGQMAIFIALIFQVLFVLFAMIINVGLIVHDKINLQNSVDLAAYYAAQRQAEVLNAIAHSNYQIRQAWKLLSWRIRVIGDLGNKKHPMYSLVPPISDLIAIELERYPTACIIHNFWTTNGPLPQDMCYSKSVDVPKFKPSIVIDKISPLAVINEIIKNKTTGLRKALDAKCENYGPLNYEILVRWIAAYKSQISSSKTRIINLSQNLSSSYNNFKDIQNESVLEGAKKTLINNLTRANANGLDDRSFLIYNSLGEIDRKEWLVDMPIKPRYMYTDFTGNSNVKCAANPRELLETIPQNCPGKCPDWLHTVKLDPDDTTSLIHSSLGYQKNPWFMAYVGVRAVTKPSKPFLPFGKPVVLRATAFAKPFGGRIGPWMYSNWDPSSKFSNGSYNERIDPNLPEPLPPDSPSVASTDPKMIDLSIPNYSRYPGDKVGLRSIMALHTFSRKIKDILLPFESYMGMPAYDGDNLATEFPGQSPSTMTSSESYENKSIPKIREFELAAIAPDLFDITYYSIDPNYVKNYLPKGQVVSTKEFNYDLGFLDSDPAQMNVRKQMMAVSKTVTSDNGGDFFLVKKWEHLLTGWMPAGLMNYGVGDDINNMFGKCEKEAAASVPGSCASGGRVGYSVKIVSRDYLMSDGHKIGGPGVGPAPIKNPPPDNF